MVTQTEWRGDSVVNTGSEKYLEIEYKYLVTRAVLKKLPRAPIQGYSCDTFYTNPMVPGVYRVRWLPDSRASELTYKNKFNNWNITRKEINISTNDEPTLLKDFV